MPSALEVRIRRAINGVEGLHNMKQGHYLTLVQALVAELSDDVEAPDLEDVHSQTTEEVVDKCRAGSGLYTEAEMELRAAREAVYGKPNVNCTALGQQWQGLINMAYGSIVLDRPLPPHLVCLMMCEVKLQRLARCPDHEDSFKDLLVYAKLGHEMGLASMSPLAVKGS